jgi:probable rRNA maturation factor
MPRRAHPVSVHVEPGSRGRIEPRELRRVARVVMAAEGVAPEVGLEVALAGPERVRELNRLYRGRDEPTDVLSFAAREVEVGFVEPPGEGASLGEVVVCAPVAERQALESGRPPAGEIAHLLVHGLLHMLGYDHEDPGEAERMKRREDEILTDLGYAGDYAHGH